MRAIIIVVAISVFLWGDCVSNSYAVGYYSVGKEDCACSPLVARGIVPDTLNQLKEALMLPRLGSVLERLAVDFREMLTQFAAKPNDTVSEPVTRKEPPVEIEEPTKVEKKNITIGKPNKLKKVVKDPSKKKRLKVPTKAHQRTS
ncbi:MAG: hypothetical protein NTW27_09450 [Deltaproteobacteria bacterium]|jgi:hypothetical protein|nr:hypothetical protein [Deltaproteobacteria bacterium]